MATTAAQDKERKTIEWAVSDHFGNEVICSSKAWNHTVSGHPELKDMLIQVQQALMTPHQIKPSTTNPAAFAFELTTEMSVEIRVVASYDEPHLFSLGKTIGKMNTAMPIDLVTYDRPNIGEPIYTRKGSSIPDQEKEAQ